MPDGFQFVFTASRWITHEARLADVDQAVGRLIEVASTLGRKLGPLLFQLPPDFKKDAARLRRPDYDGGPSRSWLERLRAHAWEDVYVFFKHEDEGLGPCFATRFLELRGGGRIG